MRWAPWLKPTDSLGTSCVPLFLSLLLPSPTQYNDHILQLFTSSLFLAAAFAALVGMFTCKKLGRRYVLVCCGVLRCDRHCFVCRALAETRSFCALSPLANCAPLWPRKQHSLSSARTASFTHVGHVPCVSPPFPNTTGSP